MYFVSPTFVRLRLLRGVPFFSVYLTRIQLISHHAKVLSTHTLQVHAVRRTHPEALAGLHIAWRAWVDGDSCFVPIVSALLRLELEIRPTAARVTISMS